MASNMEVTSGSQNLSTEREIWIDEEVEALLDVWGDTYISVKRENLGKRHWETVVREVNQKLSHQREQPQMKNKIDSLKKRYKREKLGKGENDRSLITWKWYDRCDVLWGTPRRPRIAAPMDSGDHMEPHPPILHLEYNHVGPSVPSPSHADIGGDKVFKSPKIDICPEVSPQAEASLSPGAVKCCNNAGSDSKVTAKRRKCGTLALGKNIATLIQGFADTYSRIEQAKMEMAMTLEERRLQFLERMEERRLDQEEKHMERKEKMEENRLEIQEKHLERKLEMQEKHMQRRETLKLEMLRLRLEFLGQKRKQPEVEQAVQTMDHAYGHLGSRRLEHDLPDA